MLFDLVRESEESVSAVARRLGISNCGLRRWVAQAKIDEGRNAVPTLPMDWAIPGRLQAFTNAWAVY